VKVIRLSTALIGQGPYLFGPSFFFGMGTMRFLADSQTLSLIFHGVYFTP
jgi:hypothetical protein